jgi:hypothetical protein
VVAATVGAVVVTEAALAEAVVSTAVAEAAGTGVAEEVGTVAEAGEECAQPPSVVAVECA